MMIVGEKNGWTRADQFGMDKQTGDSYRGKVSRVVQLTLPIRKSRKSREIYQERDG